MDEEPNDEWENPSCDDNEVLRNYVMRCCVKAIKIENDVKDLQEELRELHLAHKNNLMMLTNIVKDLEKNATQKSQKVFVHVPSEIAAHEVEEIGVEHLLRDVKDTTISTLATKVSFNPYFKSFHV
ncbi:26S proteasome non-ATPase regulatory subunit 7 [Artemisia annua]|uniref:26S proteasome non-ATPase regulatory subunit 7 n=1 Tax=Artemisia annua TaxID=35608 RepID=A0A2U1NGW9_ARTAN|nr:26S proteasome non-ATPase regulatory subunit 7 [Artemisia annua]